MIPLGPHKFVSFIGITNLIILSSSEIQNITYNDLNILELNTRRINFNQETNNFYLRQNK